MKTTSYRLRELNEKGLAHLEIRLEASAIFETHEENKSQYIMPDGKTTIQIRKVDGNNYVDITNVSLITPRYVRKFIRELENDAEWIASRAHSNKPNLSLGYNLAKLLSGSKKAGETQ